MKDKMVAFGSVDGIENRICFIRGYKVILDDDLARLYGVSTKRLNQQVHRNADRFPNDFMFQLTSDDAAALRLRFATSKTRGGRRFLPYAFTEHGAIMVSAVLKTPIAVQTSIQIARAFVALRRLIMANAKLAKKLEELEDKLIQHDYQISDILKAIRRLMYGPRKQKPKIGYLA